MNRHPRPHRLGISLIETVIAMAVLAVTIPLIFAALAGAGKSGISAEFETRSPWIVEACLREVRATRIGKPEFLTPTKIFETIPPTDQFWAIAFSAEGKPIKKIDEIQYQQGLTQIANTPVRYLAVIHPPSELEAHPGTSISHVRISIEYPSIAPASKRQHLDFYSQIL
jgi:type II secretory pathway pseudopilin PulG